MDVGSSASYLVSSRLSEDWSADNFQAKPEVLAGLTAEAFGALDPLVKARLLLSCLLTAQHQPGPAAAAAAPQLRRLGDLAAGDDDAWVKVMGAAAGDFDGRLDINALCAANPKVQSTVSRLRDLADSCTNAHLLPPLEAKYLAPPSTESGGPAAGQPPAPRQQHFTPRDPREVPAASRPRVRGPMSPQSMQRQGSMQARRGTSTGEDTAFRPARAAEAAARHQAARQVAPGPHHVESLSGPEAAALASQLAAGTGRPRKPLQLKKMARRGAEQQQQQQGRGLEGGEEEDGAPPAPLQPLASPEGSEGEEGEREGGGAFLGSSAARMAAWDDDDDEEGGGAAAGAATAARPAGRRPQRRGRLLAGGARDGAAAAAAADASLEDEGVDDVAAPEAQQRTDDEDAQMRELFEDSEEAEEQPAAAAAAAAEAAAAAAPGDAGEGGAAKAKRRRAVISDEDDD